MIPHVPNADAPALRAHIVGRAPKRPRPERSEGIRTSYEHRAGRAGFAHPTTGRDGMTAGSVRSPGLPAAA